MMSDRMLYSTHGHQRRLYDLLQREGEWYTRGTWQSVSVPMRTLEAGPVTLVHDACDDGPTEATRTGADMPWAEDHFQERIGGVPLNPAPSYRWWPWHSASHADDHTDAGVFDHTYPERFWPKLAGMPAGAEEWSDAHHGVRFRYGDLGDVIAQLQRDPFTRQAYLPVWFPEDTGARDGVRVPCSLGYHFLRRRACLDLHYAIRSCDLTRHFRNDLYLAVRLLQHVAGAARRQDDFPTVGKVYLTIHNLHVFESDLWRYQ